MADLGKCRSCGAAILWVEMAASGKKNPLDAEPVDNGNVHVADGVGTVLTGETLKIAKGLGEKLHISHFASCPNRLQHRKPR